MEVHHHPHVEKKSFKEYLLEYIMIFLAVTTGFFAESLREYINEHSRAKEFALTMVNDLSADTANLNTYLTLNTHAANSIDTFMHLLSENDIHAISSGKLYYYGLFGGRPLSFVPHDATINQMKYSGSLRYFTNKFINREVAEYDQLCRKWAKQEETDRGIYIEVRKARSKIFEFKYNEAANQVVNKNRISFNQYRVDSFIHTNPPLLTYDKTIFNEYVELVRSRFMKLSVSNADTLLVHATSLMKHLQEEYHLENE